MVDLEKNEEFKKIIDIITKRDNFLVIVDSDPDGISAGVLTKKIMESLNKKYTLSIRDHKTLDIRSFENLFDKYDAIITIDSPFPDNDLIDIAKKYNDKLFLYIDHHKRSVPENIPDNLVYFDIRALYGLSDDNLISTGELMYKFGKKLFGNSFKKYSIIAAMGAIGDWTFGKDSELIEDLMETYSGIFITNNIPSKNLMILYTMIEYLPAKHMLTAIEKLGEDVYEMIKNYDIWTFFEQFREFYKTLTDLKPLYIGKNLRIYMAKGNTSMVSTFLSSFFDGVIVVLSKKTTSIIEEILPIERFYKVSLRCQGKRFDVGKIMSEYPKKIHGGGHIAAAGGLIRKEDLEDFIEYLKSRIENIDI